MDSFRFVALRWGGHRNDGNDYIGGNTAIGKFRGTTLEDLKDFVAIKIRVDRIRFDIVMKCWVTLQNSGKYEYTLYDDDGVDVALSTCDQKMPELDVDIVERVDLGFPSYDPYCGPSVVIPTQVPIAHSSPQDHNYPCHLRSASGSNQGSEAGSDAGDDFGNDPTQQGELFTTSADIPPRPVPHATFHSRPETQYGQYDAIRTSWVLPRADQYSIRHNIPNASSSNVGPFYKGKFFRTKEELKTEFRLYAMRDKFNPQVRRSTKYRYEVGCRDITCKFSLKVICREGCTYWQVRKFVRRHTCTLDTYESHFRKIGSAVIGTLIALDDRVIRPVDIVGEMREHHGVQLLYTKAWRVNEHVERLVYGRVEDSYQLLPSYFHLLKEANPGTVTAIHTDSQNQFLYSFFALGACIEGFNSVIRPVIAIDACHLKGEFKGVLFVASGKDSDEYAYPIAFGVGDSETTPSWTWFLERLRDAIGCPPELVIVSDRHNFIKLALERVYPEVPHCYCFFHLMKNLKSRLKGKQHVVDMLYRVAYCYTTSEFDRELNEIRRANVATYNDLMSIELFRWARAHCPRRRWQMMTTNIAEALNNCIKRARKLPITAAMEFLREMLQRWFHDRRQYANTIDQRMVNAAVAHCRAMHDLAGTVHPINLTRYVAKEASLRCFVDLEQFTCSCRKWDLDQLPCQHVMAVTRYMRTDFNALCHKFYSTDWMKRAYESSINPVPHIANWVVPDEVRGVVVLPPEGKRQTGSAAD